MVSLMLIKYFFCIFVEIITILAVVTVTEAISLQCTVEEEAEKRLKSSIIYCSKTKNLLIISTLF